MRSMMYLHRNPPTGNGAPAVFAAGVLLALLAACVPGDGAVAPRFVPTDADTVLADASDGLPGLAMAGMQRRELAERPADASLAAEFARNALQRYASNGDARLLGYAEQALAPWADDGRPPRDIWLLRARLAQTRHEFSTAADDLAAFLEVQGPDTEALLLAGDAARRAGDTRTARRHCIALQLSGQPELAQLCAADVLLTLGKEKQALEAASAVPVEALTHAGSQVRAWAASVLGDAAQAGGDLAMARAAFKHALAVSDDAPLALRISYIDVLVAQRDYDTAATLLQMQADHDALLLRRAIIARDREEPELGRLRTELAQRFELAATGDPSAQLRERALFELRVERQPQRALELAVRNWQLQKGWEDARLLLDAADAAGDYAAVERLLSWRESQWSAS